MRTFLSVLCLSAAFVWGEEKVSPVSETLRPGQPHWRSQIAEAYPSGVPLRVMFFEQIGDQKETAVKQRGFYPNGQVKFEMDLTTVEEDSPGAKEWKSTFVPHGVGLWLHENGRVEKIAHYDRGVLHGEMKLHYPDGTPKGTCVFQQGKRHGKMVVYYEDGLKAEEASYLDDKLTGDLIRYYPKNVRAQLIPYEDGVPHGHAMDWYESGALKASRRFDKGLLHSDGKNPAVVVYNEEHAIQEVQDFQHGEAIGTHLRYHPNGKESYKVLYKNGKKEGKEQFFSKEGKLLGEGLYQAGIAIGKHWRNHENGKQAFLAEFDEQGKLKSPVEEFNDIGIKTAMYTFVGDKLDGRCYQWYDDGSPKAEYNYIVGDFDGEQKEYFPPPKGQKRESHLKMHTFYRNKARDGVHEEWHENGQMAIQMHLKQDVKDGVVKEWHENGKPKLEEHYLAGKLDQVRREWHENGKLKFEGKFGDGSKEGVHREWNEKGDLIGEVAYENDLLEGQMRLWFEKNKLRQTGKFVKGKREGKTEEFYANGQLKAIANYKDDKLDGKVETFHEDGSPWQILSYKDGLPLGEHKEYFKPEGNEKGKLARAASFNEFGKPDGEHKTFYPSGAVQSVVHFANGELHGSKSMWDSEGNLVEEYEYQNGKLNGRYFQRLKDGKEMVFQYKNNQKHGLHEVFYPTHEVFGKKKALEMNFVLDKPEGEAIEFDEAGNKISVTPYVNGMKEGTVEVFHPKGQVLMRVTFSKDKKEGPAIEYYPDGKIAQQATYVNDQKQGEEKSFHSDGKQASSIPYVDDKIHGLYRRWNEKGTLVFEAEYKKGLRHGKFNKYYDSGKPMTLQTFADDQLHGVKKSYDEKGALTQTKWEKGKKI